MEMFMCHVAHRYTMDEYLAGLLYGDGTMNRGKNRAFAVWIDQINRNKEIAEEATKKFKKMGLNVHQYGFLDKTRSLVYSKALYLEFESIRKSAVDYFNGLTEMGRWNFISGFFDAEGTVTDRVVIYNGDLELLKAISEFLKSKGIVCYIYKYGKIFGVQIYQKSSIEIFKKNIHGIKIRKPVLRS